MGYETARYISAGVAFFVHIDSLRDHRIPFGRRHGDLVEHSDGQAMARLVRVFGAKTSLRLESFHHVFIIDNSIVGMTFPRTEDWILSYRVL